MNHLHCIVVLTALSSFACSEDTKSSTVDAGSGGGATETGGAHSSGGATSSGGAKATGGASNGGANAGSGGKSNSSGGKANGTGGKATGTGGASAGTGGRSSGGASGSAGKAGSGGSAGAADAGADASTECVTYCKCMAMNCPDQVFPTGCLNECAAGTKWDLECRQGMCSVALAQPANNHCIHAFGVNECLDKP